MTDDARLMAAMAAASPAKVDPAFILNVMRRAEHERYETERLRAMLRGAAVAALASAAAVPLAGWAAENAEAVLTGGAAALGLFALLTAGRRAVSYGAR